MSDVVKDLESVSEFFGEFAGRHAERWKKGGGFVRPIQYAAGV